MQAIKFEKDYWAILLVLGLFGTLLFYNSSIQTTVSYSLIIGCLSLSVWLLLFQSKWFYLFLILLIPISQDVLIGETAKINLPSEIMLVVIIPVFLLFNLKYQKGLWKLLKHPVTVIILLDLFIGLISALTSNFIDVGIKRIAIQSLFFFGFYVTIPIFNDFKKLSIIWLLYVLGLVPVIYHTLSMHAHYNFNPRVVFNICSPYYSDHTIYGACLAFIIPFLIIVLKKRKDFFTNKLLSVALSLMLLLVIVSEFAALSRAAILSLFVTLIFYWLLKMRISYKSLITILIFMSTIVFFSAEVIYGYAKQNEAVSNDGQISNHLTSVTNVNTDASNLERINRWICAIRMFEEKPLLGFGPGTYQFEYNQFQSVDNKTYISTNLGDKGNAHSEYLTALSEKGIVGGILFLVLVLTTVYIGMQNHYSLDDGIMKSLNLAMLLGLITFFFHGIFNAFLDQSKMAFLVYSALGTIAFIHQKNKSPQLK